VFLTTAHLPDSITINRRKRKGGRTSILQRLMEFLFDKLGRDVDAFEEGDGAFLHLFQVEGIPFVVPDIGPPSLTIFRHFIYLCSIRGNIQRLQSVIKGIIDFYLTWDVFIVKDDRIFER
jgi:hypothetical protein